jgi:pimeloyl-ACP methyl ester carboxylesterase
VPSMVVFQAGDGIDIPLERRGVGPVVYVCHGGPSNVCDTLMRDLAPLKDAYTLIFHDYRGSGGSAAASPTSRAQQPSAGC